MGEVMQTDKSQDDFGFKKTNILKHDYIYIVTNSIKNDIQKGNISAPAKVARAKLSTFICFIWQRFYAGCLARVQSNERGILVELTNIIVYKMVSLQIHTWTD